MPNYVELEKNIKSIIDDLQGLCSTNGLSNTAYEEVVVTSVFLYKFLNDKFMANLRKFCKDTGLDYQSVIKNEEEELDKIVDIFVKHIIDEDFSVLVTYDQIKEKNYSFSAGQYFDVKIEYIELTSKEFEEKMNEYKANLSTLFAEGKYIEDEIIKNLEGVKYE